MTLLSKLEKIDKELLDLLSNDIVDVNKMNALLQERKICLFDIKTQPNIIEKKYWIIVIERSKNIFNKIKIHRDDAALNAKRLLSSRKSIETYKKFE